MYKFINYLNSQKYFSKKAHLLLSLRAASSAAYPYLARCLASSVCSLKAATYLAGLSGLRKIPAFVKIRFTVIISYRTASFRSSRTLTHGIKLGLFDVIQFVHRLNAVIGGFDEVLLAWLYTDLVRVFFIAIIVCSADDYRLVCSWRCGSVHLCGRRRRRRLSLLRFVWTFPGILIAEDLCVCYNGKRDYGDPEE